MNSKFASSKLKKKRSLTVEIEVELLNQVKLEAKKNPKIYLCEIVEQAFRMFLDERKLK